MNKVIDPHLHLFNLEQGVYRWLKPDQAPYWPDKQAINRTFVEADLDLGEQLELAGFVHIEAGFDNAAPEREIAWLEQHCTKPFRTVAYTNLNTKEAKEQLAKLSAFSSVVGIRHILDEQAAPLLGNPIFRDNLARLAESRLIFEAQLSLVDVEAVNRLVQIMSELPELKVVINHCGFPRQLDSTWMDSISRLACYPECYIKCSGWEMLDRKWNEEKVKPFISFTVRQFGLTRVMLASNFPVSELSASYADVWQRNTQGMQWGRLERDRLCYENALRIYQIPVE